MSIDRYKLGCQHQCPQRGAVNLVEGKEFVDGEIEDVNSKDEDDGLTKPDDRDLLSHYLVVQRLLLTPRQKEHPQRHSIFKTRYTVNRKVCDVIIDSGSTENIVSRYMVSKLGLKAEKNPLPYRIGWIKKSSKTKVTHTCHFPFSICKNYLDEVKCHVVEMDACHIILGRPWQSDVDTVHNGQDNIYTFMRGGEEDRFSTYWK